MLNVKIVRKRGKAIVKYNTAKISPDKIVAAISRAGYPARVPKSGP